MYDFPAAAPSDTDYRTAILIFVELVTLAVLFWFSIRKPRMNSPNKFRVWFVLSTGIVCGQLQSNAESQFFTSFVVPTGIHSIFPADGKAAHSLTEITDGTSNLLLIMEACGARIVWTNPQDIDVDSATIGINLPSHEPGRSDGIMSSRHTGGAQAALADGSVRFISADTDPKILKALLTVDGNDSVGDF